MKSVTSVMEAMVMLQKCDASLVLLHVESMYLHSVVFAVGGAQRLSVTNVRTRAQHHVLHFELAACNGGACADRDVPKTMQIIFRHKR